ncbi:MAG: polysaccharide biosynthesis tyrosine autokinase [Actinomycetota bacterium]|nr:polysaccharide biosynthesis tyrosine autokinase [Actinomycetota bacterium]
MAEAVTVPGLLRDALRRWKVAAVVLVAVTGGVTLYAQSLPNQYSAKVVMAFAPRPDTNIGGETVRLVLPKYESFVTSRATVNRVAPSLGENPSTLNDAVEASIATDSGNLTIRTELPSAVRAARAANALSQETLSFAGNDPLLQAQIVVPALPSSTPSGPPRLLLELTALVVGGLLGVAFAFLLERGRPRVRSWRDVGVLTGYPVVGRIPPSRALRTASSEALSDPAVGAAVRTLRTYLERSSRERPVHVLVVTSSVSGEGKTTLAATLALSLARLDAEVLLIDADLRRPGIGRFFGLNGDPGLSGLLRGEKSMEECLQPGPVSLLGVLPTSVDPDAGDLLARRFADVLTEARERFDVIVVDAPPLLGGDDARTLATLCDGVLMVVGSETLATSVSEAASALDALGVRVLGAVANRARDPKGFGAYGTYGLYGADKS